MVKKRAGFPCNSSASSFCIYGVGVDRDEIQELLHLPEGTDVFDLLESILKPPMKLQRGPPDSDMLYIGREWAQIKDDETALQFKQSVQKVVDAIFGKPMPCETHEEGWYDG